jgi:hypothetical protein
MTDTQSIAVTKAEAMLSKVYRNEKNKLAKASVKEVRN